MRLSHMTFNLSTLTLLTCLCTGATGIAEDAESEAMWKSLSGHWVRYSGDRIMHKEIENGQEIFSATSQYSEPQFKTVNPLVLTQEAGIQFYTKLDPQTQKPVYKGAFKIYDDRFYELGNGMLASNDKEPKLYEYVRIDSPIFQLHQAARDGDTKTIQELLDAGVNVLALNIDTLQEVPNATAEAKAMADRMNFSFPAGMASPEVIEELQRLHNSLLQMNRPLPMPTSFLIDQQGFLHTIYKGAVSVDTLLEDGQSQPADLLERFQRAVVRKGTVLEGPIVSEAMLRNEGAALMRLGKDYLKEGKLARAEDILKDALVKMPDTVAIHNQLAILYEQAARRGVPGKINLAKKHYLDAIAIEPDKPTLRINLAQLLIQQRAFDEAVVHLKHALENAPATADAHYNMGMIYSSKRDVDNEKISYEKALEINPEHPQALYRLGRIFEQQQANDEAQAYYRRAVNQAAGNPLVVTSLARVLISSSENNEARQLLETVIRNQPRYPDAHYQLGRLYLNSGRPEDAEQKFLDTLKIKRNHPGATRALRDLQMSGQSPSP